MNPNKMRRKNNHNTWLLASMIYKQAGCSEDRKREKWTSISHVVYFGWGIIIRKLQLAHVSSQIKPEKSTSISHVVFFLLGIIIRKLKLAHVSSQIMLPRAPKSCVCVCFTFDVVHRFDGGHIYRRSWGIVFSSSCDCFVWFYVL